MVKKKSAFSLRSVLFGITFKIELIRPHSEKSCYENYIQGFINSCGYQFLEKKKVKFKSEKLILWLNTYEYWCYSYVKEHLASWISSTTIFIKNGVLRKWWYNSILLILIIQFILKDCSENAKAKKELLKEMEEEMSGEEDVQDSSDSGL